MHSRGKVCCLVWKDKKLVLLLSSHVLPQAPEGVSPSAWHLVEGVKKNPHISYLLCVHERHERGRYNGSIAGGIFIFVKKSEMVA